MASTTPKSPIKTYKKTHTFRSGPSKDHSDADTASVDTVTSQPHNGEHLGPVATQHAAKCKVMDAPPKVGPPGANIPEACPGDLLHIWDANSVSAIVLSLLDGGVDPSEDVEYVDCMLNHVFQGMGQFGVKLLKLIKALHRCVYPNHEKAPLFHECSPSLKDHSTASPTSHPLSSPVWCPHPLPSKAAHCQAKTVHFSDDDGSGNDGDSSELEDDENTDEDVHQDNTTTSPGAKTQGKSYVTGPLPIEHANEVKGLTQAFTNALAKLAEKHNHPLHQVERLANLTSTLKAKHASNTFNGYARKWKKEGLPALPSSELKDVYLKEKEAFDGDPKGLESWLEDLHILAQTTRVDNDIKLTQGSKVAKFMAQKKKAMKAEMVHMAKFDVHTILFVVAGQAGTHAAHAQNAVICGSPEIKKIANGKFNLDKCLNDLFVKVLHQCLNRCGLLKWHEETKKAEKAKELKSRDAAYSAALKYIRNLFVDHAWFPNTVPWTCLLFMLAQHHVHIVGWPLEAECPAPHPRQGQKTWEGGEWRYVISEFHKGKDCSIKVKSWNSEDEDEDEDIALIIDRTGTVVCRVHDIAIEHSSLNTAGPSNVRHLSKDSCRCFTQSAKSEGLSSTNPPNSKCQKGKKAQPKSTEVITSGDEMDNDSLGLDAPNKPTKLTITHPILHQHLDGPQNYGELGLNALQGASVPTSGHTFGKSNPLFCLAGPSDFVPGQPNSDHSVGLTGPSNFVPGQSSSDPLFGLAGQSNFVPGQSNSDTLFGLAGQSNCVPGQSNSDPLFGLTGQSNCVPGQSNSDPLFGLTGQSNFVPCQPNSDPSVGLAGLAGPSNFVPHQSNSVFGLPGPSNSVPGVKSEVDWSILY
ncbi:hypothetical protein BS47DRAFT_1364585 [Hydnum rufescens UP504]|uniref:Uncharacterized protein n=1 Tax=Hydnum rufescens UP504 TaxID=1448309 RepID=A0A9P6DQU1_9AGAM|nr:hypothetical protein BS47DRAFT_1364585 [Hydnum rufescens UP504]